jgi:16S rRNA C1402 N4-methylase RsmH
MNLDKRLQALEGSRHDTRGATLLIRTIQALRTEDSAELAALEVELASATSVLASTARAMLVARPWP